MTACDGEEKENIVYRVALINVRPKGENNQRQGERRRGRARTKGNVRGEKVSSAVRLPFWLEG